jgi:hypothetical protein
MSKKQKKILQIKNTLPFKKKQVFCLEENTRPSSEIKEDSV